ncbi:MAG: hypothetical protein DRO18_05555 [Thermoprotei archaeon]|nr:MAG: hypothetical protein DRO18_05555 [Thermoprotei archaeon]
MYKPIGKISINDVIPKEVLKHCRLSVSTYLSHTCNVMTFLDSILSPYVMLESNGNLYVSNEVIYRSNSGISYFNGKEIHSFKDFNHAIRLSKDRLALLGRDGVYAFLNGDLNRVLYGRGIKYGGYFPLGKDNAIAIFKQGSKYILLDRNGDIKQYLKVYVASNYVNGLLVIKQGKDALIKFSKVHRNEVLTYTLSLKDNILDTVLGVDVGGIVLSSGKTIVVTYSGVIDVPFRALPIMASRNNVVLKDYTSSRLFLYSPSGELKYLIKVKNKLNYLTMPDNDSLILIDSNEAKLLRNNVWRILKLPITPKYTCYVNDRLLITDGINSYMVTLTYPYLVTKVNQLKSCGAVGKFLIVLSGADFYVYDTEEEFVPTVKVIKGEINEFGPAHVLIAPYSDLCDLKIKAEGLDVITEYVNKGIMMHFKPLVIHDSYDVNLMINNGLVSESLSLSIKLKKPSINELRVEEARSAIHGYLRYAQRFNGVVRLRMKVLNTLERPSLNVCIYALNKKVGEVSKSLRLGLNDLNIEIPLLMEEFPSKGDIDALVKVFLTYNKQMLNLCEDYVRIRIVPTPTYGVLFKDLDRRSCKGMLLVKHSKDIESELRLVCSDGRSLSGADSLEVVRCELPAYLYITLKEKDFMWRFTKYIDDVVISSRCELDHEDTLDLSVDGICVNGLLVPNLIIKRKARNPLKSFKILKWFVDTDGSVRFKVSVELDRGVDYLIVYNPLTKELSVAKESVLDVVSPLWSAIDGFNLWLVPIKGGTYWKLPLKVRIDLADLIKYAEMNSLKLSYYIRVRRGG